MPISSQQLLRERTALYYHNEPNVMLVLPEEDTTSTTKTKCWPLYAGRWSSTTTTSFGDCTIRTETPCLSSLDKENLVSSTTLSSSSSQAKTGRRNSHKKKSVSFGTVNIRCYEVILGDHPCCSTGCPLSLGWIYQTSSTATTEDNETTPALVVKSSRATTTVDEYETRRAGCRRGMRDLRLTWMERRDRILWQHHQKSLYNNFQQVDKSARQQKQPDYKVVTCNQDAAKDTAAAAAATTTTAAVVAHVDGQIRRVRRIQQRNRTRSARQVEQRMFFSETTTAHRM